MPHPTLTINFRRVTFSSKAPNPAAAPASPGRGAAGVVGAAGAVGSAISSPARQLFRGLGLGRPVLEEDLVPVRELRLELRQQVDPVRLPLGLVRFLADLRVLGEELVDLLPVLDRAA